MRELSGVRLPTRVKGRPALVRRLRGLLLAVHRYARHRATAPADRDWCIALLDSLTHAVQVADPGTLSDRRPYELARQLGSRPHL